MSNETPAPTGSGATETDEPARDAAEADAHAAHEADRPPTELEEELAEAAAATAPDVSESYREMAELGADLEGEGRIEGSV